MGRRTSGHRRLPFALALVLATAACGPRVQAPTVVPTPAASNNASTGPTATAIGPSNTPTAAATSGPFVAANVQVSAAMVTKIHGSALAIAAPDDGTGRLFVVAQEGQIWSIGRGPAYDLAPMLDLSKEITSGGERGLLGLALHPGFAKDPRAFVNYTDLDGNTVIASFRLTSDGAAFDPSSEQVILRQQQPFPNHNGGGVEFGPDGDLYIALGDGGSGGDPQGNGQNLGTFLAKMLRIDVDVASSRGGGPYTIPADDPFVAKAGAKPEIWLYGLRNPFRFSFDRATGDLWIGDVGQDHWEEIDVVRAADRGGEDFGWNITEGNHCFKPADGCNTSGLTPPVSEYGHDQGCAVIGGNVYRGAAYPILDGGYLFSDSCSATLWAIPASATSMVAPVPVGQLGGSPAGFGEDQAGELYLARLDGTIWQLSASSR
jgi:glucose/arabinose dehydrogenase